MRPIPASDCAVRRAWSACAGPVFAAPTADAIYEAAKAVDTGAGVLFMVKNYTGDRGQFGMACEMCEMDDINAKIVIADDDVAVKDSTFTAGRRGVAGAILGYKIVCAAAEEGKSLDELVELADRVNANVRSMGFGLTSCTTSAKGAPTFEIGDDEMEIGVGLHGEPGRQHTKLMPADEIVGLMTQNCLDDFMANGEAVRGLCELVEQAGAELVGVGIAIEKGFQGGGDRLRNMGVNYHALAVIEKADENGIIFRED